MSNEHAQLLTTIRHFITLPSHEEQVIEALFEKHFIKAGGFFLQAGEVCRYAAFVTKGLLRYYVLDDGEEHTYDFSPEQTFACNYESFLTKTPSTRTIQAIEDTTLLRINYENLQHLYHSLEHGQEFGRLVAEQLFVDTLQKLTSFYRALPTSDTTIFFGSIPVWRIGYLSMW